MAEATRNSCEGLMIKSLQHEATYIPNKRNWIKLKKDYMDGCGDTLDLCVIGAWKGKGKRSDVYGAYLMATYDRETDEFQVSGTRTHGAALAFSSVSDRVLLLFCVVVVSPSASLARASATSSLRISRNSLSLSSLKRLPVTTSIRSRMRRPSGSRQRSAGRSSVRTCPYRPRTKRPSGRCTKTRGLRCDSQDSFGDSARTRAEPCVYACVSHSSCSRACVVCRVRDDKSADEEKKRSVTDFMSDSDYVATCFNNQSVQGGEGPTQTKGRPGGGR